MLHVTNSCVLYISPNNTRETVNIYIYQNRQLSIEAGRRMQATLLSVLTVFIRYAGVHTTTNITATTTMLLLLLLFVSNLAKL